MRSAGSRLGAEIWSNESEPGDAVFVWGVTSVRDAKQDECDQEVATAGRLRQLLTRRSASSGRSRSTSSRPA